MQDRKHRRRNERKPIFTLDLEYEKRRRGKNRQREIHRRIQKKTKKENPRNVIGKNGKSANRDQRRTKIQPLFPFALNKNKKYHKENLIDGCRNFKRARIRV